MSKRRKWQRPKELRWQPKFTCWNHPTFGILVDYDSNTCLHCGGKAIHPYTGVVSEAHHREMYKKCSFIECVDEGRSTVGYKPICKYGLSGNEWLKKNRKEAYDQLCKEVNKEI